MRLTIPHFFVAFVLALAAMPLEIYNFHQREIGTAKIEPWLTRATAAIARSSADLIASIRGWAAGHWRLVACAVLILAVVLVAPHAAGAAGLGLATAPPLALPEIREAINKLGVDMEAIVKKAGEEKRELTTEEAAKFDTMDGDREKLLASERRLKTVETIGQGEGRRSAPAPPANRPGNLPAGEKLTTIERAEGLRAWFMGGTDEGATEAQRELARRCGINVDSKRLKMRLAPVAPRSIRAADLDEWEKRYLGVDTISPDLGGHYTVPPETMRSLETALLSFGGMRKVSSVIRTQTGADLPIPTVNDTGNKGELLGESLEVNEGDAHFSQLVLESYKYSSKMILVSVEYLQDNAINAAQVIGKLLGERIARITNDHFTTGSGTGQPRGIVIGATSSSVTTASASAISYDEIIDLKHSVDPAYRDNGGAFMFHDSVLKALKKIKVPHFSGDTGGYPLWRPGMQVGEPDTIDGDPFVVNQSMATLAGSAKSMIYGDLSKYTIRDVLDVTLLRLDERFAEFHQVAFLAFSRHDGDLLDAGTHPVKYLTQHS